MRLNPKGKIPIGFLWRNGMNRRIGIEILQYNAPGSHSSHAPMQPVSLRGNNRLILPTCLSSVLLPHRKVEYPNQTQDSSSRRSYRHHSSAFPNPVAYSADVFRQITAHSLK